MLNLLLASTLSCLKEFYAGTNGDSWIESTNWSSDDYCSFFGVKCVDSDITELNLPKNNVNGSIPACFSDLTMQVIDLSNNSLSGDMPNVHANLNSLNVMFN